MPRMPTLHNAINSLASDFAHQLLAALRGASLEEIISETSVGHAPRSGPGRPRTRVASGGGVPVPFRGGKRKAGRLARRSAADIAKTVEKIVALVKANKKGINAEGIKAALKVDRRELPKPLGLALKSKKIRKKGHKRATKYFAG